VLILVASGRRVEGFSLGPPSEGFTGEGVINGSVERGFGAAGWPVGGVMNEGRPARVCCIAPHPRQAINPQRIPVRQYLFMGRSAL